MRVATMGRVVVKAKIENLEDLHEVEQGQAVPGARCGRWKSRTRWSIQARHSCQLPRRLIQQLGTSAISNAPEQNGGRRR